MDDLTTVGGRLGSLIGDGRRISIRAFAKAMQERDPRPPGSTRAMIHRYLKENGPEPPGGFMAAAAVILNVNKIWLAFGEGHPTEADAVLARTAEDTAGKAKRDWRALLQPVQQAFGEGGERLDSGPLRMVILETWHHLWRDGLTWPPVDSEPGEDEGGPAWHTQYRAIGRAFLGGEPTLPTTATYLGVTLSAPFRSLPIHPQDLSDDDFNEYVFAVCTALRRLADAHRRHDSDLTYQTKDEEDNDA